MQIGTNLFSMRARDYTPATGQFLSNDPIGLAGGDTNVRRYVDNYPTALTDPSGLDDSRGPYNGGSFTAGEQIFGDAGTLSEVKLAVRMALRQADGGAVVGSTLGSPMGAGLSTAATRVEQAFNNGIRITCGHPASTRHWVNLTAQLCGNTTLRSTASSGIRRWR